MTPGDGVEIGPWMSGEIYARGAPIFFFFFFNDPAPPEIYPLPLHVALPISARRAGAAVPPACRPRPAGDRAANATARARRAHAGGRRRGARVEGARGARAGARPARRAAQIGRAHV